MPFLGPSDSPSASALNAWAIFRQFAYEIAVLLSSSLRHHASLDEVDVGLLLWKWPVVTSRYRRRRFWPASFR